jgi:long-chain fatty acid transport protein
LTLSLGVCSHTSAEGFRNPPPGAFDLGRSGGRFAHVDDSSAVWNNPANLVDLSAPEAQFAPSVVYFDIHYDSPTGASTSTEHPWKLLPNFFAALPFGNNKYAVGLGLTVPYGLSVEWKQDSTSPFRYTAPHFNELITLNANPTFTMRVIDQLTIGVGLDVMWSQLTLRQFYPWFAFPPFNPTAPDGTVQLKGDGVGFGGNIGLTWQPTPRQRFALTLRSPVEVSYDGDFTVNNITPVATAAGATPRSDFGTKILFPTILGGGYGFQITDDIRLEIDGEWLQFSNFDSLDVDAGNNNFLLPARNFPQRWKDTFTAGIGGDWKFAEDFVLRASYQFYESPVPDETFSPTIPDANQHVLTVGLGYHHRHHSLELAYGLDLYDERTIANGPAYLFNGTYELSVHLFSFSYRYVF